MSEEINTELLEALKEMVEECCLLETSKGPVLPIHEQPEYIQRAMLAIVDAEESGTPPSRWKDEGRQDPHGNIYDCERAALCRGNLTDDELANEVFMSPDIGNLTAAKERIRWLSRALVSCHRTSL